MKRLWVPVLLASLLAGCAGLAPPPHGLVDVQILAINDLHGHLQPPAGGITIADPKNPRQPIRVPAGGAEYMATLVKEQRAQHRNTIFVAAGDLIGASPLPSALFHDEPTIEALSLMGLAVTAVGNHEFDQGKDELLRMQYGGCHPTEGCTGPHSFAGATFQYLAANTVDTTSGQTLFPAYVVQQFDGLPMAFIGLALKSTPTIVTPTGVEGLTFTDEAETVNTLVPVLQQQGNEASPQQAAGYHKEGHCL